MSVIVCTAYDVSDAETYAKYNPGSLPVIGATIAKQGGTILAASHECTWLTDKRDVVAMIEFPSPEAAQAWFGDPEYQAVAGNRVASTTNAITFIVPKM